MSFHLVIAPILALASPAGFAVRASAAIEELLAAERDYSNRAAKLAPAAGIGSILAEDARLYTRQGVVRGGDAAEASLAANAMNKGTSASWRSVRGDVSADGRHGFTLGYLDIAGGDPKTAHRRYLAYWVRGSSGWRVAAFKQAIRAEGEADAPAQAAARPLRAAAPEQSRKTNFRSSLTAAEKAFSDRAQVVGLRQAFQENGRPDAIHLFGKNGFAIGLDAIAANFDPDDKPSPINWSADDVLVASSGDLGVTFGTIRPNDGSAPGTPFFTVWMRDDPSQPWRYVAE